MNLKKRKNFVFTLNKGGKTLSLRSAALGGIITLAIGFNSLPIINPADINEGILHNNVNYTLQETGEQGAETTIFTRLARVNYNLPGMPSLSLSAHKKLSVTRGGVKESYSALMINGIAYIPLKEAVLSVNPNARVTYNSSTKTSMVTASGLVISVTHGGYVMYANDRPLFSFSPAVVMNDGKMYVSASALLKALGLSFTKTESTMRISGSYKPLLHASKFYREDEVYWLSKIISAESAGESLIGQIAVGDVIMNRVKSPLFPNTIYSVIFDRKYGVQFSPTLDGRIYQDPTYTATLAAKICLEGVSLSDEAMYFLNPRAAQSNWIVNNRPYAYTIGNHDFYR